MTGADQFAGGHSGSPTLGGKLINLTQNQHSGDPHIFWTFMRVKR